MAMSKKNYEAIADLISKARGRRTESRLESLLHLQHDLDEYFAQDNPNFDKTTFDRACMSKD